MTQPLPRTASPHTGRTVSTPEASSQRPRGGRPTKAAAEALERRILEAAARLFASQGFAATTMEQIAAECQAGKDTIYRRYGSKAVLFEAVTTRARNEIMPELEQLAATKAPALEGLRRFARTLLSVNLRPELLALNRVALAEAVNIGEEARTPTKDDPIMILFVSLVRAAQIEGLLCDHDPMELAEQLLYATSIKPLLSSMMGRADFAETADQDAYFDRAWNMFLRGAQGQRLED